MTGIKRKIILSKVYKLTPLILLYFSVLNEFDFNYLNFNLFSFNFTSILIFYWCLKGYENLGYVHIFLAGLINDVVIGFPMGVSAFSYLLICGFSAYLRNITLRPSLLNDWFFFLFTILVVTSVNYILLFFIFSAEINYYDLLGNIIFTFFLYIIFAYIFNKFQKITFKESND